MFNNKLENLKERLTDLEFERETCVIKLESLDENGLCASLEKEKVKTQERLRIIRNLIRVLEEQKREVTEERIPGLQDHQVSTKERSCRGEMPELRANGASSMKLQERKFQLMKIKLKRIIF